MDLLIAKAASLEDKIAANTKNAEEEIKIINDFMLNRNSKIQGQIDGILSMLEAYIRDNGDKTISLPHGTLKLHKKPDKVEIIDMKLFLSKASESMLTVVPESVKPNLNKIKNYMKMSGKVPLGVKKVDGIEEFKLSINKNSEV